MTAPPQNGFANFLPLNGQSDQTPYGQNPFGQQQNGSQVPFGGLSYQPAQNNQDGTQGNGNHRQLHLRPGQQQLVTQVPQIDANIDPALLQMDTQLGPPVNSFNGVVLPGPLSNRQIFAQDTQHGSAIIHRQQERDISPLSVGRPEIPAQSQSTHETLPDAPPTSNLGIESNDTSGMRQSNQEVFNQLQMSIEEIDRPMGEQENLSDNVPHSTDAGVDSLDDLFSPELADTPEPSLDAGEGTSNSVLPREQLSEAQKENWDTVENAANTGDLFGLFPDLNLENTMNNNFDAGVESSSGTGSLEHSANMEVDTLVPDFSKEWPFETNPQIEAMEAMGRVLETGMATPFLEQTATASTNLLETTVNEQTTNNYDPKRESFEDYLQRTDWDSAFEGLADAMF